MALTQADAIVIGIDEQNPLLTGYSTCEFCLLWTLWTAVYQDSYVDPSYRFLQNYWSDFAYALPSYNHLKRLLRNCWWHHRPYRNTLFWTQNAAAGLV